MPTARWGKSSLGDTTINGIFYLTVNGPQAVARAAAFSPKENNQARRVTGQKGTAVTVRSGAVETTGNLGSLAYLVATVGLLRQRGREEGEGGNAFL
ncbi:MAG: hypothetical protein M3Y58_03555 [Chloroflexota bacterium]|nr:hypothetical protein [Chloroflexota bacterium]